MIKVKLNGQEEELESGMVLSSIIEKFSLSPRQIVIQVNDDIVAQEQFSSWLVKEADQIEIIKFMAGG